MVGSGTRGPLVINAQTTRNTYETIIKQVASSTLFAEMPIIIVDLPRAASSQATKDKLYSTLEAIQGTIPGITGIEKTHLVGKCPESRQLPHGYRENTSRGEVS